MPKPRPDGLDKPWVPKAIRAVSRANVWLFEKTGGRLGASIPGGAPVGVLTTIGKKSGEPRRAPLLYLRDGERIVLVASQGGQPKHPLWYFNLEACPDVRFQAGRQSYDDYQSWTERVIPVVILEPR